VAPGRGVSGGGEGRGRGQDDTDPGLDVVVLDGALLRERQQPDEREQAVEEDRGTGAAKEDRGFAGEREGDDQEERPRDPRQRPVSFAEPGPVEARGGGIGDEMAVGLAVGGEYEQAEQDAQGQDEAGEGGQESARRSGEGHREQYGRGREERVLLGEEREPQQREGGPQARPADVSEQARGGESDGQHVHARERAPGLHEPRAQGQPREGHGPGAGMAERTRHTVDGGSNAQGGE